MEDLVGKGKNWPLHLDFTKDECKKFLRAQELSVYSSLVSVFRAQGEFTKEKKKLLHEIQTVLNISTERHRAEMRRAVNDEALCTIAHLLAGPNTSVEWAIEGRRLIPLLPRAAPLVAYSAIATRMAQKYCSINYNLPRACGTAVKDKRNSIEIDSEGTDSENETEGLRYLPKSMIPTSIMKDCGSYTMLPLSEARIESENIKKKMKMEPDENLNIASETIIGRGIPVSNTVLSDVISAIPRPIDTSTPLKPSSTLIPVSTNRRKRKRSVTSDPTLSQRPQPVVTLSQNPSPSSITQITAITSKVCGQQFKLETPADNTLPKTSTHKAVTAATAIPQSQKMILVSTSAANSSPEISYIRSNSLSVKAISPSIGKETITLSCAGSTNTVGTTSVNMIGSPSIQIKPSIATNKASVQVRQDTISGRVIARTPTAASSAPQNVYVVTTNSGMITVVARNIASQSTIGGHRVVSVNTVVPRTSLASVKSTQASTMSMSKVQTVKPPVPSSVPVLRPMVNATKNNVIVLQRSNNATSNVRSVGMQSYKDISTKNVQRPMPNIIHGAVNKTNLNGACSNKSSSMLPGMVVIKSTGPATKIIPAPSSFTPTCSITEVPARTMAPSLIYVEPNFGGKKTSTIRTTLNLTSTSEGMPVVSSRLCGDESVCRVTSSSRSFTPVTTIIPPSIKRQIVVKETEIKRMKDIKENNIPLLQINKSDKPLKKLSDPCVTKITKLSTSLTNLYASTMSKKPAILSNNFAFAKSAKKPVKDDQNDSRDVEKYNSILEKADRKTEVRSKIDSKSESGDDEMSALVERAVEVLRSGDKEQARILLHKAGLELHESPQDDQVEGESFTISSMNPEQNASDSSLTSLKGDISKDSVTFDITRNMTNSPLPIRKITHEEIFSSSEGEKQGNVIKIAEEKTPERQKVEINPC